MTNSRGLELGDMENVSFAGSASLNGGMAGFSVMAKAAGDVLRNWEATDER